MVDAPLYPLAFQTCLQGLSDLEAHVISTSCHTSESHFWHSRYSYLENEYNIVFSRSYLHKIAFVTVTMMNNLYKGLFFFLTLLSVKSLKYCFVYAHQINPTGEAIHWNQLSFSRENDHYVYT